MTPSGKSSVRLGVMLREYHFPHSLTRFVVVWHSAFLMEQYETWLTQQWLTSDQQTYRMCLLYAASCREQAPVCNQVSEGICTVEEA